MRDGPAEQPAPIDELTMLLEGSLRDEITDEQLQRLEWLVVNDDAVRRRAAEYLSVSHALRSWADASDLVESSEAEKPASSPARRQLLRKLDAALLRRPRTVSFTVATIVVGLLVTAMGFYVVPPLYRAVRQSIVGAPTERPVFVARLTSVHEARWLPGQIGTHSGAHLAMGKVLHLEAGFAEITFDSGAKMALEGPVSLTIDGANESSLAVGKVVAKVPTAAHGFTVSTAHGRIVDLGTEFAVEAISSGDADVHVITGRVEVRKSSDAPNAKARELHAGSAVRISEEAGSTAVTKIAYDVSRFARVSPLADVEWSSDTSLPVGRALSLWLAADFGLVYDSKGRVMMWKDRLTGDNRRAENAMQSEAARRPLATADGIGGQPALVFDGRATNLLTRPRAITGEQTIFIVAKPAAPPAGQLLNTGAVPNYVVETTAQGGIGARSYNGQLDSPSLRTSANPEGTPLVIVFSHSQAQRRAWLTVNGETQAASAAPTPISANGQFFIGSHVNFIGFYSGRIAEVIVYDAALSDVEIAAVQGYLGKKYAISP